LPDCRYSNQHVNAVRNNDWHEIEKSEIKDSLSGEQDSSDDHPKHCECVGFGHMLIKAQGFLYAFVRVQRSNNDESRNKKGNFDTYWRHSIPNVCSGFIQQASRQNIGDV